MNENSDKQLKSLPSIQNIFSHPTLQIYEIKPEYLKHLIQKAVQKYRVKIQTDRWKRNVSREELTQAILDEVTGDIERLSSFKLKRVINATGIILHTNLGRAPLAPSAVQHLNSIINDYCNLEIDLANGKRGDRISILEEILCLISGAEAAVMVNNNAAAVLLTLNSLAKNREVPVSRGELVEIGGSFRMPDVMKAGNTKMIEIGTTNKTHLRDYSEAISTRTGAILKVHTSNFKIFGFTQSVPIDDLVALAHKNNLPLLYDMGSGVIEGLENWGYPQEPIVRESLKAGVDVVTFSGDKVLGGPQAGLIVGKKKYLQKIKNNHLLRALRCDKITYALMEATLRLYLNPKILKESLPAIKILNAPVSELKKGAEFLKQEWMDLPLKTEIVETDAHMGSGALPLEKIPSVAIRLLPDKLSVSLLARKLRLNQPAILGYIEKDFFYLNLRTVNQDELPVINQAVKKNLTNLMHEKSPNEY
jgi:L-seryl-tRNA(Ser) seleniumtransferase